jgi:hypothetical protein
MICCWFGGRKENQGSPSNISQAFSNILPLTCFHPIEFFKKKLIAVEIFSFFLAAEKFSEFLGAPHCKSHIRSGRVFRR